MKHYSEQDPIKPEFDKQAALEASLANKLEAERMGKETQRRYDTLLESQQKSREIKIKMLEIKRAKKIREKANELLHGSTRPAPRPRWWQSISLKEKQRAAKHDATAFILRDEMSKIARFDATCLQQQKEFLASAKLKEARQSISRNVSNDNSRSMSREFNSKGGRSL